LQEKYKKLKNKGGTLNRKKRSWRPWGGKVQKKAIANKKTYGGLPKTQLPREKEIADAILGVELKG